MSVIAGHQDNDDKAAFALPFQKTSMVTEKFQFLVRCEDSIKVPHRLEDLANGK